MKKQPFIIATLTLSFMLQATQQPTLRSILKPQPKPSSIVDEKEQAEIETVLTHLRREVHKGAYRRNLCLVDRASARLLNAPLDEFGGSWLYNWSAQQTELNDHHFSKIRIEPKHNLIPIKTNENQELCAELPHYLDTMVAIHFDIARLKGRNSVQKVHQLKTVLSAVIDTDQLPTQAQLILLQHQMKLIHGISDIFKRLNLKAKFATFNELVAIHRCTATAIIIENNKEPKPNIFVQASILGETAIELAHSITTKTLIEQLSMAHDTLEQLRNQKKYTKEYLHCICDILNICNDNCSLIVLHDRDFKQSYKTVFAAYEKAARLIPQLPSIQHNYDAYDNALIEFDTHATLSIEFAAICCQALQNTQVIQASAAAQSSV